MPMEYSGYISVLRSTHPELASELGSFRGLGKVMEWMATRGVPLAAAEIIQQDEFSLDFVIPLGVQAAYLAFGIT
jgi:hypothetical protein